MGLLGFEVLGYSGFASRMYIFPCFDVLRFKGLCSRFRVWGFSINDLRDHGLSGFRG